MGAVADLVEDVGGGVLDLAGSVVDVVGDALEDTWDVVSDAADWTIDTASGIVQGALDDPIRTIAQVAAVSTGNAWLLPYISAADVAASGGDIGDIAKAAAISYATQAVASEIAGQVGSGITVDDAGIPLLPADVAYHAASGVAGATGSGAAGTAAAGSANNAFNAAVRGGDLDQILKSAISGGVAGGTSTTLSEMGVPRELIPVAGGAIAGGTSALLYGNDVYDSVLRGAAIGGAGSVLNMTGAKLKELYNENKSALSNYFKSADEQKIAAKEANDYYNGSYKKVIDDTEKQGVLVEGIRTKFDSEKSEYERLLASYESNKNAYFQTKDQAYANAANNLVGEIDIAANKANLTYAEFEKEYTRYENLTREVNFARSTYGILVDKANSLSTQAETSLKKYENTYGEFVNESLVFNQEMSDYTKDVVAKYVENTGEIPTPEALKEYINSGKVAEDVAKDIQSSDLGQRWSDIQDQAESTSKIVGSGLYNYQDTSKEYITKAEQAFADRNSDLGMYYQYKALENEIENNPNSIYSRMDDGSIYDNVNQVVYTAPEGGFNQEALNELEQYRMFRASNPDSPYNREIPDITITGTADSIDKPVPEKSITNVFNLSGQNQQATGPNASAVGGGGSGENSEQSGIAFIGIDPQTGRQLFEGEGGKFYTLFQTDGTAGGGGGGTLVGMDGSGNFTESFSVSENELNQLYDNIISKASPEVMSNAMKSLDDYEKYMTQQLVSREDIGFKVDPTASKNPLYAESAYAQTLNKEQLPSWLQTWMDADSSGFQKETGFASSQGLTVSGENTYKDPTGNEYKKVTIGGKDYLQDVKNPTGLYAVDGTGGTSSGAGTGTGTGSGTGPGAGTGTGGGSGSGTGPGTGGGTLAGALETADYIAKNDVNKDGIVNTADSIAASKLLSEQYKQGQGRQFVEKTVQGMRRPIDGEPAKVIQGEQATLANLDTFKPETPPPAAAPNQPTGDLYFDESQVVNDNNFGTKQQAVAQQPGQPNLFFDESQIRQAAEGGQIEHNPQFFSEGGLGTLDNRYVRGEGDGTSDSVPAMLASGEFVIPADVVSGLGNGDNDAGAAVLDEFMKAIRTHKRAADPSELPEDSKGPLAYLQEAMKKVRT
jgi:hypothetical protein